MIVTRPLSTNAQMASMTTQRKKKDRVVGSEEHT